MGLSEARRRYMNKKTEPNQAVDLTICIVIDRAPSGTLRAIADRRSP